MGDRTSRSYRAPGNFTLCVIYKHRATPRLSNSHLSGVPFNRAIVEMEAINVDIDFHALKTQKPPCGGFVPGSPRKGLLLGGMPPLCFGDLRLSTILTCSCPTQSAPSVTNSVSDDLHTQLGDIAVQHS